MACRFVGSWNLFPDRDWPRSIRSVSNLSSRFFSETGMVLKNLEKSLSTFPLHSPPTLQVRGAGGYTRGRSTEAGTHLSLSPNLRHFAIRLVGRPSGCIPDMHTFRSCTVQDPCINVAPNILGSTASGILPTARATGRRNTPKGDQEIAQKNWLIFISTDRPLVV